jgi:hypothetical protein
MSNTGYSALVQRVNTILGQYKQPLTLRQIYYRLVADYKLPNKRSSYNILSRVLVKARELGEVDDTRIEDRSREVLGGDGGFESPEEYLEYKVDSFSGNNYTRPVWIDQPSYVEVWVEKDALSRVLSSAAAGLRMVVAPSRGYSSYTYLKRMAIEDRFQQYADKPIIILDFRDHDPSGIQMTEDLEKRLQKYGEEFSMDITVKRIALTFDQVRRYRLDPNPVKNADTRSAEYVNNYGASCWELDALPPETLTRLVQQAIQNEIDQDAWEESVDWAKREKEELEPRLREMADAIRKMFKP